MIRARARAAFAAILFGGAWFVACVPPLPGDALDDGARGAVGSSGAAGSRGGAGNYWISNVTSSIFRAPRW